MKKMNNLELTQQKDSITSEIDKKLDKATKTMKGLRMENQELIKLFYENKDYLCGRFNNNHFIKPKEQ